MKQNDFITRVYTRQEGGIYTFQLAKCVCLLLWDEFAIFILIGEFNK